MFKNNFQISSIITFLFFMLSISILSFFYLLYEQRILRGSDQFTDSWEWWIMIGISFFVSSISVGLYLKIDLTRKIIQGIGYLGILAWLVMMIRLLTTSGFHIGNRLQNLIPLVAVSVAFLSYMIGLIALFGHRIVKAEFEKNEAAKIQ